MLPISYKAGMLLQAGSPNQFAAATVEHTASFSYDEIL